MDLPALGPPRRSRAPPTSSQREGLANAAKHARAERSPEIRVARRGQVLRLEIIDDGIPAAPTPTAAACLWLRRRVEALDGTFRVLSPAGRGRRS